MFDPYIILFLILSAVIFWIGIFVLSANPFDSLSRVGAFLLFTLSIFLVSGAFIFSASTIDEFKLIFKLNAFTVYLPAALWYHAAVLINNKVEKNRKFILIAYLCAALFSSLEVFSNLVINYDSYIGAVGRFKYNFPTGPLFFAAISYVFSYFGYSTYLFWKKFQGEKVIGGNLFAKILPVLTSIVFIIGIIFIVSTFIFIRNSILKEAGEATLSVAIILLAINVLFFKLFVDGSKSTVFKELVYSSITTFVIVVLYSATFLAFKIEASPNNILFSAVILYLILITHSFYDWVMSFVRNIFHGEISLPRVTDEEVNLALRNLNRYERLESSTLLRLKLIAVGNPKSSLDKLRDLIKESIEYFKQNDLTRSKTVLKYNILKMISEQVEEGQILWDLGFEEYPLEIAEKGEGQKPRFAIQTPTDYQATSRNAFIALKKEAIHDLAWRISYLEKHVK